MPRIKYELLVDVGQLKEPGEKVRPHVFAALVQLDLGRRRPRGFGRRRRRLLARGLCARYVSMQSASQGLSQLVWLRYRRHLGLGARLGRGLLRLVFELRMQQNILRRCAHVVPAPLQGAPRHTTWETHFHQLHETPFIHRWRCGRRAHGQRRCRHGHRHPCRYVVRKTRYGS